MREEVLDGPLSGDVVWAALGPSRGREQTGHRPAVVVASNPYLLTVDTLAIVVPVTSVERGWSNHVRLEGSTGLDRDSFAMTEQPQTISRTRITRISGSVDRACLDEVRRFLAAFLDLPDPGRG